MKSQSEVLIVGAGLAGLSCARVLQESGVSFTVIEASDGVGGRVRTDKFRGYQLDRGFQVLLSSYPEVRRMLDIQALDLRAFEPGALIRAKGRFMRIADPWRSPFGALRSLYDAPGTFADKLRIGQLRRIARSRRDDEIRPLEVGTTIGFLRRLGFGEEMIESFMRPFFGGVFLDPSLHTSARLFLYLFRLFSAGDTVLPSRGMGSIPEQLRSRIPAESLLLRNQVAGLTKRGVRLKTGKELKAKAVVIATDGEQASLLLPALEQTRFRGTTCFYFTADHTPIGSPILVLNGEGRGPINNLSVLSDVAPSYAPAGKSLVSVTVLGTGAPTQKKLVADVESQLVEWFGKEANRWKLLKTYRIPHALPDQSPPFLSKLRKPVRVREGIYVCGDHRETGSIQGALASGRRAADAFLEDRTRL